MADDPQSTKARAVALLSYVRAIKRDAETSPAAKAAWESSQPTLVSRLMALLAEACGIER